MKKTEPKPRTYSPMQAVGHNQDLLTFIFHRLPATSLLRCQCVSKHWYSLISDPKFRIHHTRYQKILNPPPSALLLQEYFSSSPEFQLVPLKCNKKVPFFDYLDVSNVKIEHSCNGLIAIRSSTPDHIHKYFVCNPTTKQFRTLPNFTSDKVCQTSLSLAFDPLKSPHYKVICIHLKDGAPNYSIAVYSSESDSWRMLRADLQWIEHGDKVFRNGVLYYQNLMCFDVDNEIFKSLTMPPASGSFIIYFGESQDHLLLALAKKLSPPEFDVFEMESDYSGWSLRYSVNLDSIIREISTVPWNGAWNLITLLSVIQGEMKEDMMIVMHLNGEAMSCSLCGEKKNKLCDLEQRTGSLSPDDAAWNDSLVYGYYKSYRYFESLACP